MDGYIPAGMGKEGGGVKEGISYVARVLHSSVGLTLSSSFSTGGDGVYLCIG